MQANHTGQRLLRERPRVYRRLVELLAEPNMSVNRITKRCRVSEHTVRAVRDREAISIAERKTRLMSIFANVAEISAERMEEMAATASLRDAGVTAGIATDKLLALSGDPLQVQHAHVHIHKVDIREEWDRLIAEHTQRRLPTNGEPLLDSGAEMDLLQEKKV
jgi:hypothetical protein